MRQPIVYNNSNAATTDYPYGSYKNVSSPGAGDGTQIKGEHINDATYALIQVLQHAGVVPNNEPEDGNENKQFINSLLNIGIMKHLDGGVYQKGVIAYTSIDGVINFYKSLVTGNDATLATTSNWQNIIRIDTDGKINFLTSTNITINNKITDCIIEAPNGVLVKSVNALTAKNGLKVLMPNGLNVNGSFNNLEVSLESDVIYTVSGFNDLISNIYLTSNGTIWPIADLYCYYQEVEPAVFVNDFALWYKPSENKYYTTTDSGSTWNQAHLSKIGWYETDLTSVIDFASHLPVNLSNKQTKKPLDHVNSSNATLGTIYTADRDGVLYGGCRNAAPNQYATLSVTIDGTEYELAKTDSYGGGGYSFVEILKGQTYQYVLDANFTPIKAHKFIPRKVM